MAFPFISLTSSVDQKSIMFDRHGNPRISGVAGEVLTVGPQDKAIYIRMHMALLRVPIRHLRNQIGRAVPLRRTALEGNRRRLRTPVTSPEDDVVVREVMPQLHLLYRRCL